MIHIDSIDDTGEKLGISKWEYTERQENFNYSRKNWMYRTGAEGHDNVDTSVPSTLHRKSTPRKVVFIWNCHTLYPESLNIPIWATSFKFALTSWKMTLHHAFAHTLSFSKTTVRNYWSRGCGPITCCKQCYFRTREHIHSIVKLIYSLAQYD